MNNLSLLLQIYPERCKTKSNNPNVIAIYNVILEHENSDSDYWNEDHGSEAIIQIFENVFSEYDWKDLENDLNNWTAFQLELFTQAILGGYMSYTNGGIYYQSDKEIIKKITKTIPKRFDLLFSIIKIESESKLALECSNIIKENLNFINDHFNILLETNFTYLAKIQNIIELLNLSESNYDDLIDLKEKTQKASR